MNDERRFLSTEQSLAMLPDGDEIHTFRSCGMALIGADWDRKELERMIRDRPCELGGVMCRSMQHGLVVWTSETDPLFVECRDGIDYQSLESGV